MSQFYSASSWERNKIATFKAIVDLKNYQLKSTVGQKIRYYRSLNKISQENLSSLTGIVKSQIYEYEHDIFYPTATNLKKIATTLKVDAKDLMDDYLLFIYNPNYKKFFIELEYKIGDIENILGFNQRKYSRWKNGMKISKKNYIHLRNKLLKLKIYNMKKYVIY